MKGKPIKYVITAEPEGPKSKYWDQNGRKVIKPLAVALIDRGDG
jgi:hypothetical protein